MSRWTTQSASHSCRDGSNPVCRGFGVSQALVTVVVFFGQGCSGSRRATLRYHCNLDSKNDHVVTMPPSRVGTPTDTWMPLVKSSRKTMGHTEGHRTTRLESVRQPGCSRQPEVQRHHQQARDIDWTTCTGGRHRWFIRGYASLTPARDAAYPLVYPGARQVGTTHTGLNDY